VEAVSRTVSLLCPILTIGFIGFPLLTVESKDLCCQLQDEYRRLGLGFHLESLSLLSYQVVFFVANTILA
jgi:hypothetical protein